MTNNLSRQEIENLLEEFPPQVIRDKYSSRLDEVGKDFLIEFEAFSGDLDALHTDLNIICAQPKDYFPPDRIFKIRVPWWKRKRSIQNWFIPVPALVGAILAFTGSWLWLTPPQPKMTRGQVINTYPNHPDAQRSPYDTEIKKALIERAEYLLSNNRQQDYFLALSDLELAFSIAPDKKTCQQLIQLSQTLGLSQKNQRYQIAFKKFK